MEKNYAQAIMKLIEKGMNPKDIVVRLKELLERSGRISLLPRIARVLKRLQEKEGSAETVISVARDADTKTAKKAAMKYVGSAENLKASVDETLIGGWRLSTSEKLVDASHKKQLVELYRKVVK